MDSIPLSILVISNNDERRMMLRAALHAAGVRESFVTPDGFIAFAFLRDRTLPLDAVLVDCLDGGNPTTSFIMPLRTGYVPRCELLPVFLLAPDERAADFTHLIGPCGPSGVIPFTTIGSRMVEIIRLAVCAQRTLAPDNVIAFPLFAREEADETDRQVIAAAESLIRQYTSL